MLEQTLLFVLVSSEQARPYASTAHCSSTMSTMLIRVDPGSAVGLAEQIAGQIRGRVAVGELASGDRLPAARELAQGLDVNMHTVLRAYATLRDEGLVELRRGRGAQIATGAHTLPARHNASLRTQIQDLVAAATRLGLTRDQLLDEIRKEPT